MHTIPQNVTSYEDKIVGQFVGRQFIYLAIGGVIAFLLLTTQLGPLFIRFFLAVIVGMFAAAMALLKIQDRGFDIWVFAFLRAVLGPTEWTWRKQAVPASVLLPDGTTEAAPSTQAAPAAKPVAPKLAPREKIDQFESYLSRAKNDLDEQEQDFLKNLDYSALPPDTLYAQQPAYAGMLTPEHPQPQPLQSPPSPLPAPPAGMGLAQSTEDKHMSFAVDGNQESVNLHQNQEVGRALSSQVLSGGMLPLPVHGELHLSLSRDLKNDFSHLVGFAPADDIKAEPSGALSPATQPNPPVESPQPSQLGSTFQIPHQPLQIITDPSPVSGPSQAEIEQQKAREAEAARQAQDALAQAEAERQRQEAERQKAEEAARQEALIKAQVEEEQRRQEAERQRLEAERLAEEQRQQAVKQEQERVAEEQRQQAAEELRRLEAQRLVEIEAEMRAKAQEEIERVRAEAEAKTQAAVAAEEAKAQVKLAEEEKAREAQIQAVAGKYEEELSKLAEHTAEVEKRSEQAADQLRKMEEQVEQLSLQGQSQASEETTAVSESQDNSTPSAEPEMTEVAESKKADTTLFEPELTMAQDKSQPAEETIAPLMVSEDNAGDPQPAREESSDESMGTVEVQPLQLAEDESLREPSGTVLSETPVDSTTSDVPTVLPGNESIMDLPTSSLEGDKINNERIFPTSERIKQLAEEVKNTPQPKVVEATILNDQNMLALTTQPNVINGVVFDRAGQFLPGVVVVIKDNQNEPKRALKTNKLGQFVITTPLPNGSYSVAVEKKGITFDVVQVELSGGVMPPLKIQGY